jgi:N-acetylglutamate synthase-like GNAT family acetyltransferase
MLEVYELKDKVEYFESVVQMFWDQWGTETNFTFYHDCMFHSMKTDSDLPRFYIAIQNESIIGTYALLRNDLISRQDIFPWLACLYVAPEYRGQNVGAKLLQHALQETWKKGHDKLYLCTNLNGFYEKYGWIHLTSGYIFNGVESKIYMASTSTKASPQECPVIKSIKECPERRMEFIEYVSEEWPVVKNVVIPKIEDSLARASGMPLTFMLLKNNRMIGFYQLIEQELLVRKDLSPWISPLFIDKSERGQALGAQLLDHGRKMVGELGYDKVYITTDHIQYYEKYGFQEIGLSTFEWGRPSKIYEHDTLK